jgi:hypothetical protein
MTRLKKHEDNIRQKREQERKSKIRRVRVRSRFKVKLQLFPKTLTLRVFFARCLAFDARLRISVFGFGSATRSARNGRSSAHKVVLGLKTVAALHSVLGPLFVHKNHTDEYLREILC